MLQDVLIEALYVDANGPSEAGAGKWDVSFAILPEELEAPLRRHAPRCRKRIRPHWRPNRPPITDCEVRFRRHS
jgi:hypothetical protein